MSTSDPTPPAQVQHRWVQIHRILDERLSQCLRWHPQQMQRLLPGAALAVLTEELGDVARVLNDTRGADVPDPALLKDELVQLAACCLAWLEVL